ncbi:MAG: hypothetical protein IPM32_06530 [Ignavibacteriae bacterium]|nr:hypothetical protein [Ignavibacteriota bacterium]
MKNQIILVVFFLVSVCVLNAQTSKKITESSPAEKTEIVNKQNAEISSKVGGINSPQATNVATYDFTVSGAAYVNPNITTPPMKEVAPNVFAMWNGDANNDGSITNADKAPINSAKVFEGYHVGDLNWDGSVTNADKAVVNNNKPTTPQTHVPN